MFLVSWTGLNRFHWWPVRKFCKDGELWFYEVKIFSLQITLYSVEMARLAIDQFNSFKDKHRAEPGSQEPYGRTDPSQL